MVYPEITPASRTVRGIITDLPGLVAVAVVDTDTGMNLASHSNSAQFNIDMAAAYNTQLVKQNLKAMKQLNLSGSLDDILITVGDQYHMILPLHGGTMFVYLAVYSLDTNLAIAREVMRQHAAALA